MSSNCVLPRYTSTFVNLCVILNKRLLSLIKHITQKLYKKKEKAGKSPSLNFLLYTINTLYSEVKFAGLQMSQGFKSVDLSEWSELIIKLTVLENVVLSILWWFYIFFSVEFIAALQSEFLLFRFMLNLFQLIKT